jgi:hypothetical protein
LKHDPVPQTEDILFESYLYAGIRDFLSLQVDEIRQFPDPPFSIEHAQEEGKPPFQRRESVTAGKGPESFIPGEEQQTQHRFLRILRSFWEESCKCIKLRTFDYKIDYKNPQSPSFFSHFRCRKG